MRNTSHIVKSFQYELDGLIKSLLAMKDMAIDLIRLSEQTLTDRDKNLIILARLKDVKINQLEREIEDQAITLLALRQPMARDLRFIVSCIKIVSLLERIGDRGKKTAIKAVLLKTSFSQETLNDILQMNELVIKMINEVFGNIQEYDFSDLKKAYDDDDKVDDFYSSTMSKVTREQNENPDHLEEFIGKIKILKNFERIGDYASKIAKIIYYIAEGSDPSNLMK